MSKKQGRKESKVSRYLKAPIRILIKARDFYIKSMTEYSDRIGYGTVMGCPTGQVINTLPRSFSVSSTKSSSSNRDDDLRELVRAASARSSLGNNMVQSSELLQRRQQANNNNNNVPRSRSVGIGRIDEDKPCDFEDDTNVKANVFPRSRSYAVTKRKGAFY